MFIKKITFLIISFAVIIPTYSQKLDEKFQQVLDEVYKENPESVGIIVSVAGATDWNGAVGYSDKYEKTPIDAKQPALIASSIKMYMAAAMLRLVEEKSVKLTQPIKELLTPKTTQLFEDDGYNFDSIQVQHLLSHTSGIADYVNDDYFDFVDKNPTYRWTRDEQLALAVKVGNPLAKPGEKFSYADVNYVLAAEIIEEASNWALPIALRTLLHYGSHRKNNTWFPTLEQKPVRSLPLIHQYWGEKGWDSYEQDLSWDLYGGGGIATTAEDLARFSYMLFNYSIVRSMNAQKQLFTIIPTPQREIYPYFMGIYQDVYHNMFGYGHGGFWGTQVLYFPELEVSIAVFVSERDKRDIIRPIISKMTKIIKDNQDDDYYKYQNESLFSILEDSKDFSGTVLIAHKDSIITTKVSGLASKEYNIKNELNTKFNIGSITKSFTAVAMLQLYEKGLIGLQQTVGEYLPNFPNQTIRDSVTIHQLLTNTSGLKTFYSDNYVGVNRLELKMVSDFIPLVVNKEFMFSPGSNHYSNDADFVILGLIIEKISGQNYYDYIEKNIFDMANMPNTLAVPIDSIVENKASGYTTLFNNYVRNDFHLLSTSPASSHYSTVEDLFNFSFALRNGKLLKPETYNLMVAPKLKGKKTHIGYGVNVNKNVEFNEVIIGQTASSLGIRCEWMDFLDSDYTVIILSNEDSNDKTKANKIINDLKNTIGGANY